MAKSVFLIHDATEKLFARKLAIDLSLAGATVWLDEADTGEAGYSLIETILKDRHDDIYLAVVLSPDSVKSDWVRGEVESAMHRDSSGLPIKVLPILHSECQIPEFMVNHLAADFRNSADYDSMLLKVIDHLGLGRNTKGDALPERLAGKWMGDWIWCGRQRHAEVFLSASPEQPSKMIIRYLKSGILTLVEQELEVGISGNAVKLVGTSYRLLERGISLGWNLDTFNLTIDASGTTLEGVNMDKKGIESPVAFKRK